MTFHPHERRHHSHASKNARTWRCFWRHEDVARGCPPEGSRDATNYVHNAYRYASEQSDLLSTPGHTMLLCMQGTLHSHEVPPYQGSHHDRSSDRPRPASGEGNTSSGIWTDDMSPFLVSDTDNAYVPPVGGECTSALLWLLGRFHLTTAMAVWTMPDKCRMI